MSPAYNENIPNSYEAPLRSEQEMLDLILTVARADERIRAVVLNGSDVVLVHGTSERVLGTLEVLRPVNGFEPDTPALLAAIATAWALDITPDLIAAGIKTFDYQSL